MIKNLDTKQCQGSSTPVAATNLYKEIPPVVQKLAASWQKKDFCDHVGPIPIPSHEAMVEIIHQVRRILFPGYFTRSIINADNLEYCLGQEIMELFENLARQIVLCFQYDCFHTTDACPNKFETTYAPTRSEIIFDDSCYQAEVV